MIRLLKKKKDNLSKDDYKRLKAEVAASGTLLTLVKDHLDEKLQAYENIMLKEDTLRSPNLLSGYARILKEIKSLRKQFDQTTEE